MSAFPWANFAKPIKTKMKYPRTREEAQGLTYGHFHPIAYDPEKCVARVPDGQRCPTFYQCSKSSGHGPAGLYCKAHGAEADAALGLGETETWFSTDRWSWSIREVQVTSSSAEFIRIAGQPSKTTIHSQYGDYWRTREEAMQHLRARAEAKIRQAEVTIAEARNALEWLR